MVGRRRQREQGQAAVETAIILPMLLFAMLGTLQLTLVYHARLLTEYAAYRAARAGSLNLADCGAMTRAALLALIPTMPPCRGSNCSGSPLDTKFAGLASTLLQDDGNRIGSVLSRADADVPLVEVRYWLERPDQPFDRLLVGNQRPKKIHVQVAYFPWLRIPFAGDVMARFWRAANLGVAWGYGGIDPTLPVARAVDPPRVQPSDPYLVNWAGQAIDAGYNTFPVVASFSMRMHSEPGNAAAQRKCPAP